MQPPRRLFSWLKSPYLFFALLALALTGIVSCPKQHRWFAINYTARTYDQDEAIRRHQLTCPVCRHEAVSEDGSSR
jgi:uncharacterized protein YbaR (Trm112 family)